MARRNTSRIKRPKFPDLRVNLLLLLLLIFIPDLLFVTNTVMAYFVA